MQLTPIHLMAIILITALVTLFTRAVPFLFFSGAERPPDYILYLGKILPPAVMAMLLVFSVRNISFSASPFGIPEFTALSAVVLLHSIKRNTLFSIAGGTIVYMFMIQYVFR